MQNPDTIAEKLANHIAARSEMPLALAVEEAIEAEFGNKEQFVEQFLQYLTPKELMAFYQLLQEKINARTLSADILESLRAALKKAGIKDFTEASTAERVRPSSSTGLSPYRPGGKRGK